jgi:hypothetical protein
MSPLAVTSRLGSPSNVGKSSSRPPTVVSSVGLTSKPLSAEPASTLITRAAVPQIGDPRGTQSCEVTKSSGPCMTALSTVRVRFV